jgi:hypothetical protein
MRWIDRLIGVGLAALAAEPDPGAGRCYDAAACIESHAAS